MSQSLTWAGLLSAGAVLGCLALAAGEADSADQKCIECHVKQLPHVDERLLRESVHGKLECSECHSGVAKHPHVKPAKPVNCKLCHEEAREAFAKGIHAELAKKGDPDLPKCADCHGTHGIFKKTDMRSTVNHFKVNETCLKCHASIDITERHTRMPSAAVLGGFAESSHAKGTREKGLLVAATCTDCHGHHMIRPKTDPLSPVNKNNVPETCKKCHWGIFNDFENSVHGKLWQEAFARAKTATAASPAASTPSPAGPVCSTCHNPHTGKSPVEAAFRLQSAHECGECHQEKAITYRDTFHGKATSLGFMVAAKCSDCHTAHRILPKDDPRSSVHPQNLTKTCGECHPQADANFVRYRPHLDVHDPEQSALVYYVHLFMKALLLGVFSFFGLHTLLWFQRSVVAWIRRPARHEQAEGQYVRRFASANVVLHVIVVVSFLGLGTTGLPLHYHATPWAKSLTKVLGGIEVLRFLHRVCGLTTIGYFVWHVIQQSHRIIFQRRFDLLHGPSSMLPRLQDLFDLYRNVKWFLYLGPQPRFDRWTYFEKFDYFAVFWGVPILGGTGLLLWFPGVFSAYLPGIVFNVAAVIHSEEALLATAFIFIFHFYHNHLRMENFPIDTSIFTGRIPLARFREERAEEYERLVRENKLAEALAEAPDQRTRIRSLVFGFSAMGLGLLLIFAILFSYFCY